MGSLHHNGFMVNARTAEERLGIHELGLLDMTEEDQMDSEDALAKVKDVSEGVRETARTVRQSLEEGQPPGQALAFLRDVVREAPLPSLLVAFMLGCLIARR
ncbi:hypothetical protein [Bradyrhizobium japonicum]|uniref:hypothetical protein n=2 Tax=Bradyrhizobium TaxID=374 RepID=UPI002013B0F3|nr:hypothetical protein [Bradyrhizobium japonicum]